uniref:Uncharacterized protein n=1 Tax=Arundo donax TaxID=35708 RepID=A0A0A8YFF2_ARUDO
MDGMTIITVNFRPFWKSKVDPVQLEVHKPGTMSLRAV